MQNEDLRRDVLIKEEMKALQSYVEDLSDEMAQAEKNLDFSAGVIYDLRCKVASQHELMDATLEVEREAHVGTVTQLIQQLEATAAVGDGQAAEAAVKEAEAAVREAEAAKAAAAEVQVLPSWPAEHLLTSLTELLASPSTC
jgi:hypothetical protein